MSVAAMAASQQRVARGGGKSSTLQRKCECAESESECEACRKKHGSSLQRFAVAQSPTADVPPIVSEVLRSPGRKLDPETREFFEDRLGHDFSLVQIHTDTKAATSASSVGALAYTAGSHVVFGSGQFAPSSAQGRRLLAHELTHTVQQGPQTSPPQTIGPVFDPLESEATHNERLVQAAGPNLNRLLGLKASPLAIQRQLVTPLGAGGGFGGLLERDRRRAFATPPAPSSQISNTDAENIEAGVIALANVLRGAARNTALFRDLYNEGLKRIAAEISRMRATGAVERAIAQRASALREALAKDVREVSGALLKKSAELFDSIRGNVGRPTYESLRAAGRSDAEIIASATRSNRFINRLPSGLRWTGRALWVVSAAISVYVIVTAPEGERPRVAEQEAGGLAGGAAGAALAEGVCVAVGIATEGLGLIACGLLGGLLGFEGGRRLPDLMQDIGARQVDCWNACQQLPWYEKGFCQLGCSGMPSAM